MKRRNGLILAAILGTMLAGCGKGSSSLSSSTAEPSSSSSRADDPTDRYEKRLAYKDGFRILWLTDIHLGKPMNTATYDETKEYAHLRKMIEQSSNPDLIVITGDTFEDETVEQSDAFVDFIDSFNIKWAFTYGNHDSQAQKDDPFHINSKIMAAKNSVFVDYDSDAVDGYANYFINLYNETGNVYRLYVIDSNADRPSGAGGDSVYDVIHPNQLAQVRAIDKAQNDEAAGLAFFHIPLRQYATAYQAYLDYPSRYAGEGTHGDGSGYGYKENGAYACFQNAGIIGTLVGHDHFNDIDIDYFDESNHMTLAYGLKSSGLNYHSESMIGYKIITLPSDPAKFNHTSIVSYHVAY